MARQYVPGVGVVIPESGGGGALPSNLLLKDAFTGDGSRSSGSNLRITRSKLP